MKFLVDQNRSPRLAQLLRGAGHDAVHTLEHGLEQADDDVLLDVARDEQWIVISGDTDFGALLALARRKSPSVVLFRSRHHRTAQQQVAVILEHLDDLADDLTTGATAARSRRRPWPDLALYGAMPWVCVRDLRGSRPPRWVRKWAMMSP